MTEDKRDWYPFAPRGPVRPLDDLGELAARLGSIVTFDRRGDVVWLDDFESGIGKWYKLATGTNASIDWSAGNAKFGGFSCRVLPGDADNDKAYMWRYWGYPVLSKGGIEFSFNLWGGVKHIIFLLHLLNGSMHYYAEIKLDIVNGVIYYRDKGGNYQVAIASKVLYSAPNFFHTAKIVGDFVDGKYVRLIVNEESVDLSAYDLYQTSVDGSPNASAIIEVCSKGTAGQAVYIDGVIITQNEP